jgi:cytochrome c-type biogenesis protein CcmE
VLNQRRFIVGAALIAAAVSYLVYAGIRTTSMYYFELAEFESRRSEVIGQTLRVKGWVANVTVDDPRTNELRFDLAHQDGHGAIPVAYRGIKPDMFSPGREVVVEGRYEADGRIAARQIMTSCPSKYEAEAGESRAGS